jgi:quercetin dioxygenase-like cupin family protein
LLRCDGKHVPTSRLPIPHFYEPCTISRAKQSSPRVKRADDLDRIPPSTVRSHADFRRSGHRRTRRASFLRRSSGQAPANADARLGAETDEHTRLYAAAEAVGQARGGKTRHARDTNWRDLIVDDRRLTGEYVAAAAGTRTDRRFHPDTREWFAVVEGEVKVEIEGQPAIAATRGSLVNIPRHTMYTIETVGEKPSLRFVVNVAKAKTLYPHNASIVGRSITLDDEAVTIVGVMPASFQFPYGAASILPGAAPEALSDLWTIARPPSHQEPASAMSSHG